jgi:hypothetical protein
MWRPQTSVRLAVSNVLGHVVLLETLIETGMLTTAAILTGSEAARGVPKLRIKRPTFAEHSVDEFTTVIDGSFFAGRKVDSKLAYGQTKYLGAPWLSALARKHSTLRLVTVSPGNTSGTDGFRDFGLVTRTLLQHIVMPYVAPTLGMGHKLEDGAKRLVDAVIDDSFKTGGFYASAPKAIAGPLLDQAPASSATSATRLSRTTPTPPSTDSSRYLPRRHPIDSGGREHAVLPVTPGEPALTSQQSIPTITCQ